MTTELSTLPLELRHEIRADGDHVLHGLCVPYGQTTMKAGYPRGERFVAGAFAELAAVPASKVRLTDSHDESGRRPIGVGTEFRDTDEGLFGSFRFYNTPEGRGGRENVLESTYGGLSIGFLPLAERQADDGAREILRARLFHVSLVDEPAYDNARVLAVRAAIPDVAELLAVTYALDEFPADVDLAGLVFGRRA